MNAPTPDPFDRWERVISQACRDLPPLPAPSHLRERVLAELERREARAWWQRSFLDWPRAGQLALLALCALLARLSLLVPARVPTLAGSAPVTPARAWARIEYWHAVSGEVHSTLHYVGATLLHYLPLSWLYIIAAGMLGATVVLATASAGAWRALHTGRIFPLSTTIH